MTGFPLALAVRFADFTAVDTVVYSLAALFLLGFAVYYRRSTGGEGMAAVERRKQYVKDHPDLEERIRNAVVEGRIEKGMSEDDVTASLGRPHRVQILSLEPDRNEVWIYRSGIYASITNGILTQWRVHRKLISIR